MPLDDAADFEANNVPQEAPGPEAEHADEAGNAMGSTEMLPRVKIMAFKFWRDDHAGDDEPPPRKKTAHAARKKTAVKGTKIPEVHEKTPEPPKSTIYSI